MGMSMHVVGFRPADDKWNKMKAAWDACEAAGLPIPEEVENYFEDEYPGDKPGMEVELGEAVQELNREGEEGYQVDVTKLPDGVRFIRFYCSW